MTYHLDKNSPLDKNSFDKTVTHQRWFTVAIILLCVSFLGFVITAIALFSIQQWNQNNMVLGFNTLVIINLVFAIPGVYCLRRGMKPDFFIAMKMESISLWWWFVCIIPFIGGIVAYVRNKDIDRKTATNILCLGILITIIWPAAIGPIRYGASPVPQFTHIIMKDDFGNPGNKIWGTGSSGGMVLAYKNNEYSITVKGEKEWAGGGWYLDKFQAENFVLEVDAKKVTGPAAMSYGFLLRVQNDEDLYRFLVSPDNKTFTLIKQWHGTTYNLYNWTQSNYINKGTATNHLKVICNGSKTFLFINNNLVAEVADVSPLSTGKVGLTIESGVKEPSAAEASFDNFILAIP